VQSRVTPRRGTVAAVKRSRIVWVLASWVATTSACDDKGSAGQSIAKALEAPKKEEPAAKAAPKAKPAPDPNAPPWTLAAVRDAMPAGTKVVYARSGTDAKGKKVSGKLTYVLSDAAKDGPTTSYTIDPDPGTNKASAMPATAPWSAASPFFAMEKPTMTIVGRESITVPAGTFDTAKAEVKDFFGNAKTVWMIVERPGLYAKVVDGGNAADDADKTEIVYELAALP
jgi:hypothetical protein